MLGLALGRGDGCNEGSAEGSNEGCDVGRGETFALGLGVGLITG